MLIKMICNYYQKRWYFCFLSCIPLKSSITIRSVFWIRTMNTDLTNQYLRSNIINLINCCNKLLFLKSIFPAFQSFCIVLQCISILFYSNTTYKESLSIVNISYSEQSLTSFHCLFVCLFVCTYTLFLIS